MANARSAAMGNRPANLKTEQFDMDSFFDFNQSTSQPSPATASSSRTDVSPKSASQDWNAIMPFGQREEQQQFNGPSHDYNQYKQQVGLPAGSTTNMPPMSNSGIYDGWSSNIGDVDFDGGMGGWATGIDVDTDMNMDFNNPQSFVPATVFPTTNDSSNFVNPNTIGGDEPSSHVGRLWPGMHSQQAQQAAMQKAAQIQAGQQRQIKLQAQNAQHRQAGQGSNGQSSSQPNNGHAKRPSHVTEPHVEESISRLLNQMRQNGAPSSMGDDGSQGNMLPHIARMKKDEEEMDEDERLLASEEGKKLSSKERRQLRNKVSARAFRSRRKEYISQLEGDLALKAQESADLRNENTALMQENERYRGLIETLLRHPAFTPFIQDISKDASVLGHPPQHQQPPPQPTQQPPPPQTQQQSSATPNQQPSRPQSQSDAKPEFMNFDASQLQVPQPQQQTERVHMAAAPHNDFSKLNINGFNSMNFGGFQSVNAFAVLDLPSGPDPVDLLIESPARLRSDPVDYAKTTGPALDILLAKLDRAARNV